VCVCVLEIHSSIATPYRESKSLLKTLSLNWTAGPTVWNSLPDSLRDLAVESERVSAVLENASLCRTLDMSALEVSPFHGVELYKSTLNDLNTYLLRNHIHTLPGTPLTQWSFRKIGAVGSSLASQAEIGVWVKSKHRGRFRGGPRISPWKTFETVYARSCRIMYFWPENGSNAVHNAFLNTLTVRTLFPCVPAAFKQW